MHDKARNTLHVMELRQRDAMKIAYLEAHLELRDAWMDDKDLDMEQYSKAVWPKWMPCTHLAPRRREKQFVTVTRFVSDKQPVYRLNHLSKHSSPHPP